MCENWRLFDYLIWMNPGLFVVLLRIDVMDAKKKKKQVIACNFSLQCVAKTYSDPKETCLFIYTLIKILSHILNQMDKVNKSSITNNIIIYGNYQRLVGGENGELVFNTYRVSVWEEKKF